MDLTRYDKLRSAIRRTLSPDEAAAADRALEYAAEHTASQVRHDGSPMLDHAAEVARIGLEEHMPTFHFQCIQIIDLS